MKLSKSKFVKFAALTALYCSFPAQDSFAASVIRIDRHSKKRITEISELQKYKMRAACYRMSNAQSELGLIQGDLFRFVTPDVENQLKRRKPPMSQAIRAARRHCKNIGTPTATPTPDVSEPQIRPTAVPTFTPTPVPTAVNTPRPTNTPTARPSNTPTPRPTNTPTVRPTNTATPRPTNTPTPRPTNTPTRIPTSTPTPSGTPSSNPPVPLLSQWESQMRTYGAIHCTALKNRSGTVDQLQNATYYDAEWVFFQIADYTHDSSWNSCAQAAEAIWRDDHVIPDNGFEPGYWNFTHGLAQDYLRTGDVTSKNAAILLAKNAAFARDSTQTSETVSFMISRETSYAIHAYLNAEDLGEPRRARLALLVNHALGHLDQWFVSNTAAYTKSFMVGLTAHALIAYYEKTSDSRILPALITALDGLWARNWVASAEAFLYIDHNVSGEDPAVPTSDVNLLIAPAYAWVYHMTGETRFRDRADQIFAGGVRNAWLSGAKQFNQNYRLSFEFMRWRQAAPLTSP